MWCLLLIEQVKSITCNIILGMVTRSSTDNDGHGCMQGSQRQFNLGGGGGSVCIRGRVG